MQWFANHVGPYLFGDRTNASKTIKSKKKHMFIFNLMPATFQKSCDGQLKTENDKTPGERSDS